MNLRKGRGHKPIRRARLYNERGLSTESLSVEHLNSDVTIKEDAKRWCFRGCDATVGCPILNLGIVGSSRDPDVNIL